MPFIQFPNVPNVPGVPQLLRRASAGPPAIVASAAGIASLIRAFTSQNQWGIFEHHEAGFVTGADGIPTATVQPRGAPAVTPDSFLNFGYVQESSVTTAPVQDGGFADYNRMGSPFEVTLRMSKGGTVAERRTFLNQIDALNTTKLYDIFTPEKTYVRCNFIRTELSRRGEKGAYWIDMADVIFREIRPVVAVYTKTVIANPTLPDATQQQNNGSQRGVPAPNVTPPPSVTR